MRGTNKTSPGRISTINRSNATMDSIKSFILDKQLKSGDPLPTEAELVDALGVSRSSVREALRKLEALDIVQVRQGRGSYVGDMSLAPMVETLVLRYALGDDDHDDNDHPMLQVVALRRFLDMGMSQQLVAIIAGTENKELDAVVAKMEAKAARGESYLDEDIAFHQGMTSYLDNPLVDQLNSAMWLVHQVYMSNSHPSGKSLLASANAHGRMLAAARAGDANAYRQAVDEHYSPLIESINLDQ